MSNQLPEIRTVDFHGDQIVTFEADGKPHVAMRRIVENMGLSWPRQNDKLQEQQSKFTCSHMATRDSLGREQAMLCMPVDKLPLWLATINPNKIRDVAIRAKVEEYQAESAIVLHDYWTKGAAIKGDHDAIVTGVDPAVMKALGGMIKGILAKQLNETVPALVEHAMIEGGHVVSTDFKPALEVLKECKVPARKRRSFSQKVSGRLRRFSTLWQLPVRISRETNRYLFHVEAIKKWMTSEGDQLIRDHVAAISGQALLHLVPPPKPDNDKPPGGKPSRRAAMTGIAVLAAGALGFTSAPPAKALPAPVHDGLAVMQIDGNPVTIDTNRYKPELGTKFAVVHFDGRMTLEPVEFTDGAPWYGKRSAATEWEAPGTGDLCGASAVRKRVWVLGAVMA